MSDRVRRPGEHPVTFGVATGRFTAARSADYWLGRHEADPEGAARLIESLSPVLPPVATVGRVAASSAAPVAGVEDEADDEFASLFPPTPAAFDRMQAAHIGRVESMSDDELMAELFGPEGA